MAVTHRDIENLNQSFSGLARTLIDRRITDQRDDEVARRAKLDEELVKLRTPKSPWRQFRAEMKDFVDTSAEIAAEMAEAQRMGNAALYEVKQKEFDILQKMGEQRLARLQSGQPTPEETVAVKRTGPNGTATFNVPRSEFDQDPTRYLGQDKGPGGESLDERAQDFTAFVSKEYQMPDGRKLSVSDYFLETRDEAGKLLPGAQLDPLMEQLLEQAAEMDPRKQGGADAEAGAPEPGAGPTREELEAEAQRRGLR